MISVLHGFRINPFIHFIHLIPNLLPHATYFLGTEDVVLIKINKVPVLMKLSSSKGVNKKCCPSQLKIMAQE